MRISRIPITAPFETKSQYEQAYLLSLLGRDFVNNDSLSFGIIKNIAFERT